MASARVEFEYSAYAPGEIVQGVVCVQADAREPSGVRHEVAIVLDVSGSMTPVLNTVRAVCEFALSRFANRHVACALVSFSDHATVHHGMTTVNDEVVSQFTKCLNDLVAGGQTNLCGGISTAYGLFSEQAFKSVIVLTDGVPNVGATEIESMELRQGLSVYTVAIGSECDHALLANIASATGGMYADAKELDDVVSATGGLFGAIFGTQLTDVALCLNADSLSMLPSKKTAFATTVSIGPLFTQEEVYVPFSIAFGPVSTQLFAQGERVHSQETAIPNSPDPAQPNAFVKTQLLRAEVARFMHAERVDEILGAQLLARCAGDQSPVGSWMRKRLGEFLLGGLDSLPTLQQELTRARSTAYNDVEDWLVPACMRAFSQEASGFISPLDCDDEGPLPRPILRRESTMR
jgi:hypothetical protein